MFGAALLRLDGTLRFLGPSHELSRGTLTPVSGGVLLPRTALTDWLTYMIGTVQYLCTEERLSHRFGGWKPKITVSSRLVSPEASLIGLQMGPSPGVSCAFSPHVPLLSLPLLLRIPVVVNQDPSYRE